MSCDNFEEKISAFVDKELSPSETVSVARHIETCAQCHREVRLLGKMKSVARGIAGPAMPDSLRQTLLAQARKSQRREAFSLWRWLCAQWQIPSIRYGTASAFAAASIALAVVSSGSNEELPIDVLLAAHDQYSMTMPLAPAEAVLARLPERMDASQDSDEL